MTYEVQFKLRDAEYTVRGPDTAGILALIDGLEPKTTTRRQDAAEATLTRMGYTWNGGVLWRPPIGPTPTFEETPLPEIEDPHAELRKTWAPGQKWLTRSREHIGKAGGQWLYVAGGEPGWHADQEYRRAPEDGWIDWAGGSCPVRAHARVQVRLKDGFIGGEVPAHTVAWDGPLHHAHSIVAYKVVTPCA